jgi:hypothetical protein
MILVVPGKQYAFSCRRTTTRTYTLNADAAAAAAAAAAAVATAATEKFILTVS